MLKRYKNIYQIHISLEGLEPMIWRRIQVPETYTFWDLHVAIQDAMGWSDCHLHEIEIPTLISRKPIRIGIPDEEFDKDVKPGWELKIKDFFSSINQEVSYTYDFGDGWKHKLTLEDVLSKEPRKRYPKCIDGARACPPEDVGGVPGYERFLEATSNPRHKDHKAFLRWIGRPVFNPEGFSKDLVLFENPDDAFERRLGSMQPDKF